MTYRFGGKKNDLELKLENSAVVLSTGADHLLALKILLSDLPFLDLFSIDSL